jgi:hypothetical protein
MTASKWRLARPGTAKGAHTSGGSAHDDEDEGEGEEEGGSGDANKENVAPSGSRRESGRSHGHKVDYGYDKYPELK